jgi:hypothetical protein
MNPLRFAFALLVLAVIPSQDIPAGTVIPIMLRSSLNAAKDRVGKKVEGRVMQNVRIPSGRTIKEGSRMIGHVVNLTQPGSSGSSIVVKFDALEEEGRTTALTTRLLAVASTASVRDAQLPITANSDTEPVSQWVTRQVGGDVVRRGQRRVASHEGALGTWVGGSSVLIKLTPNPKAGCSEGPGYDREQAVWIFSSAACGAYGLNVKIASAGTAPPLGEIEITSRRNVDIGDGSAWLLTVVAEAKP